MSLNFFIFIYSYVTMCDLSNPPTESLLMTQFKESCKGYCERRYNSSDWVDEVEELFKMSDKDKDGRIYEAEFKKMCIRIDNTMDDVKISKLFQELNSQKLTRIESIVFSEFISKDEFKLFFHNELNKTRFNAIRDKFNSFDTNQDGSISLEEFCKDMLVKVGLDLDGDGKVSFKEFKKYYTIVSKVYKSDESFCKYMNNSGSAEIMYNMIYE